MIIIAIGNALYSKDFNQRHNAGIIVLTELNTRLIQLGGKTPIVDTMWIDTKYFRYVESFIDGEKHIFAYPKCFMNTSGPYIKKILDHFNSSDSVICKQCTNYIILHDDIDLALGKISLKDGGSHRGHNGIRSIINTMGYNFKRVRIGIGRPESRDPLIVSSYVLKSFTDTELKIIKNDQFIKLLMSRIIC